MPHPRKPRHRDELHALRSAVDELLELQRRLHPAEAADVARWKELRAEVDACCPGDEPADDHDDSCCCHCGCGRDHAHDDRNEDDGGRLEEGWSVKSRARVPLVETERAHRPWKIAEKPHHEGDEELAPVPQGASFGRLEPVAQTAAPLDFRSGSAPSPGSQGPVVFRTFTDDGFSGTWPPDCSGAKAGDVVLMSGNLWLKLSVDGGASFTDLDFTKLFAADKTYGGWAGDQVIHYVPEIDCFVLYVQSYKVKTAGSPRLNQNVVKIALASPADLKKHKGGKAAWWRQWDFTSDTFGLGAAWMDFPDLSFGNSFLHVNTNVFDAITGKLFFELNLADMAAGRGLSFLYAVIESSSIIGSPIQNISGDANHFAGHVDNSTMRIYSSTAGDPNYYWRDRKVANWPKTSNDDIVEAAPDWNDWISEDHRIIGATRQGNLLWFAWTAGKGQGDPGKGFSFPRPHIQIAKFDLGQNFKLVEQTQVWNADYAFAYPSLTTNSDNEVGISLGWGGGTAYGSHAVGILGDFVVWFGDASDKTSLRQQTDANGVGLTNPDGTPAMYSRWGDYVHVRLAYPDARWFSGFGYAVNKTAGGSESLDALYVEFGRELPAPYPGLR